MVQLVSHMRLKERTIAVLNLVVSLMLPRLIVLCIPISYVHIACAKTTGKIHNIHSFCEDCVLHPS